MILIIKYLNSFIYVSDLQEEAPMEKKLQKEAGIGRPTFYLNNILYRSQVVRNSQRRDQKSEDRGRIPKEISYMGSIPRERVTLFPKISKGEKEKYIERKNRSSDTERKIKSI
jgi:hypothetical protein